MDMEDLEGKWSLIIAVVVLSILFALSAFGYFKKNAEAKNLSFEIKRVQADNQRYRDLYVESYSSVEGSKSEASMVGQTLEQCNQEIQDLNDQINLIRLELEGCRTGAPMTEQSPEEEQAP